MSFHGRSMCDTGGNHLPLGPVSSHHLLALLQFHNSGFISPCFCKRCVYGERCMCSIEVQCFIIKESSGLAPSFCICCFSKNLGIGCRGSSSPVFCFFRHLSFQNESRVIRKYLGLSFHPLSINLFPTRRSWKMLTRRGENL